MIDYDKLNIGDKIRKLREVNNFSRQYMADKLGISSRMYANIETESSSITLERLVDICNIFDCTIDQLLGFNEKNIFHFHNEHSKPGNINQGVINETELVAKLLKSKDQLIEFLQQEILRLKKK